jgi:hypothetical protein
MPLAFSRTTVKSAKADEYFITMLKAQCHGRIGKNSDDADQTDEAIRLARKPGNRFLPCPKSSLPRLGASCILTRI